jgi:diguanylate cyclase (GGDEF)-like protein
MASNYILIFGALLLGCCSGGLFLVHLTNPRLKGLGWLGAAFGAGGTGALLLVMESRLSSPYAVISADVLVLMGFVLVHVAFLDLLESESILPLLGCVLLVAQAGMGLLSVHGNVGLRGRIAVISLLVALQVGETAYLLIRSAKRGLRAPAFFNITILIFFVLYSLVRSVGVGLNLIPGAYADEATVLTYAVYIAVGLGIAFGYFWMTTATLSSALEHIARTDPLTRLYNRRAFRDWCDKEQERSLRRKRPFSLLMIDLDHFKSINDRFGHSAGDGALCAAVERMQDSIRGIDILGRWGGEEFIVLLPGASLDAALVIAQRLRVNVGKVSIGGRGELHKLEELLRSPEEIMRLTVSLGVASFRGKGDNIEDMLKRADEALYNAKATGRNRVLSIA